MKLRRYRADLHIHSCLSPCGELEMYPRQIVERAHAAGLDLIAITDHNTAGNAGAVMAAAAAVAPESGALAVIPGMEVTSVEEAHILGLFPSLNAALQLQATVERSLPKAPAGYKFLNDQVIVNEQDEVMGYNPYLLLAATRLDVYEIVDLIHSLHGVAIASHIDRDAFSIPSQLGFIPDNLKLDAVEISPLMTGAEAKKKFAQYRQLPVVSFSDAHEPNAIGSRSTGFLLAGPTLPEIGKALAGAGARGIVES